MKMCSSWLRCETWYNENDEDDDDNVTDDNDQQENYPGTDPGCDSEHRRRHVVDMMIIMIIS